MLAQTTPKTPGLYRLWKIEKSLWLEGQSVMREHVMPDALIVPPQPHSAQRFQDFVKAIEGARPFDSVEMTDREFLDLGNTVIITYNATAKHPRFRRTYTAQCTTTYVSQPNGWRVACHNHVRV